MNTQQKKVLYENIMKQVSKTVKKALNEAAESYSPANIKTIIEVFNNSTINDIDIDKQQLEVTLQLSNTINSPEREYLFDIDIVYDYTCTLIPGETPYDRDVEPTYDTLEVKITPKKVILFDDGMELDTIPAEAFQNMKKQINLNSYENEIIAKIEEVEDPADWYDDYYDEYED